MLGVSLRARRHTTQVMLGLSLRARWGTTLKRKSNSRVWWAIYRFVVTLMCQLAPVFVPTCPGWGTLLCSTLDDYFRDKSETINCMH